ncbi:MAG: hypothetical protein M3Z26_06215 [Bacteroidota bacterium]|nr:hypothetical protein [Bacteroidota bacterium]
MKIKKINYLLAATISGSLFFSCNSNSKQKVGSNVKQEETKTPPTFTEAVTCYVLDNGKDRVAMQIAISNNEVTGDLRYNYFEKDKNSGTLKGEMHGDTLLATYTFISEGKESKRDVAFLKRGDEILEGYGNVDPATGEPNLADRSSIKFDNNFILKKTDCKKDEHGCMVLMGMTWSVIKNNCIELSKTATRLNPIEMKDKAKAPTYLIFSDDKTKAEVYLPENNHSVMLERKGKEGNWTWQHDDFKLIPWKGYVLQKKGVAIYGGM